MALDEALARTGRVAGLRYFGGLSVEETAEVMGISAKTVKRVRKMAKARLYAALTGEQDCTGPSLAG